MGFFRSLKGKVDVGTSDQSYDNPQYTSGTHDELSAAGDKRRMFGSGFSRSSNRPQQDYDDLSTTTSYKQSPNPPPQRPEKHGYQSANSASDAPSTNPPPYHDWTSVPDTSLLPPPPAFPTTFSPTNNASEEAAEAAYAWCQQFPPYDVNAPSAALIAASDSHNLILERPEPFARTATLTQPRPQTFAITTKPHHRDVITLSNIPIYFAAAHHPLHTEVAKTIYFELQLNHLADPQSAMAIGFATKPYPPWRLPGWHRGSIGVHSDDGRRYINDSGGGIEFTSPFQVGEVVGVGMRFSTEAKGELTIKTRCFLTRNGREVGEWEIDEERDAQVDRDGGGEAVWGLQGEADLYVAVGLFGGVKGEVRLNRGDLLYQGT